MSLTNGTEYALVVHNRHVAHNVQLSQFGQHQHLPRVDCPARALKAWLDATAITGGPLFVRIDRWSNIWSTGLTGKSITRIIKKAAEAAGLDPADYSARSFRDVADD